MGLAVGSYYVVAQRVRDEGTERLFAIAQTQKRAIDLLMRQHMAQLGGFAHSPLLVDAALAYHERQTGAEERLVARLDAIGDAVDATYDVRLLLAGGDLVRSRDYHND